MVSLRYPLLKCNKNNVVLHFFLRIYGLNRACFNFSAMISKDLMMRISSLSFGVLEIIFFLYKRIFKRFSENIDYVRFETYRLCNPLGIHKTLFIFPAFRYFILMNF